MKKKLTKKAEGGGGTKGKIPKGYHIMPNGKLMKDSAHKKVKK